MLSELASHASFGLRIVFANMWLFRPLVMRIMQSSGETAAMVRTTYALTQLEGSVAHNVIPKQAKATVNVRVDPAETVEGALTRIKARFDERTTYELFEVSEPSPISPFEDDPAFDYLRRVVHAVYPETGIAPYVQSSCSDARHFARCARAPTASRASCSGAISARASTVRTSASTWTPSSAAWASTSSSSAIWAR